MSTIYIKGATLGNQTKDILIEGNKIAAIADHIENIPSGCKTIDGTGKAVFPGFVNMHTHSAMTLTRGYKEDTSLQEWLQ